MYGIDMSRPGAEDYYDSILQLYASWGVDFIKADNMLDGDYTAEIEALSRAIQKTRRPIVLSLSPGPAKIEMAGLLAKNAQMWRISGDFWDRWTDLKRQFAQFRLWSPLSKPDGWPDGDMLPLGRIGIRGERGEPRMSLLTQDEQRTLMTLWSIARSPLMFGGNLPDNDPFTLSLLTNAEVLAVNQKATASKELFTRGDQIAWVAGSYLAVFNIGDKGVEEIRVNWSELGLPKVCRLRDLWAQKDLGTVAEGQTFRVNPHGAAFYKLTPASAFQTSTATAARKPAGAWYSWLRM